MDIPNETAMFNYPETTTFDFFQNEMTTEEPDPHLYREGQIIVQIRKWIFCPIGCLGNVLCIIILMRQPMNRLMMTPYLVVISLNDFVYLLSDTVNEIVFQSGWTADWYCKLARYLADCCGSGSDLLVAVVAIHRAIAVSMPLKTDRYCSPGSPCKIIIVVMLCICLLFLEVFWVAEADPQFFCRDNEHYKHLVKIEAGLILGKIVIAVVTIALSSAVILHNLRQSTKSMISHCAEDRVNINRKTKDDQIGTMLLSISILFLITNVPLAIFFIVRTIIYIEPWLNEFIYVLTLTLKNLNHVLNFTFYCFSAQMFRNEIRRLFSCKNCGCETEIYKSNISSVVGHSANSDGQNNKTLQNTMNNAVSVKTLNETNIEFIGRL